MALYFMMNNICFEYATAQPLCKIDQKRSFRLVFYTDLGIQPELCFDASSIKSIDQTVGKIDKKQPVYYYRLIPGITNFVKIVNTEGRSNESSFCHLKNQIRYGFFNSSGNKQFLSVMQICI